MKECGCKYYGNQHGSFISFCSKHLVLWCLAADAAGVSPQELFNRAVQEFAENHGLEEE